MEPNSLSPQRNSLIVTCLLLMTGQPISLPRLISSTLLEQMQYFFPSISLVAGFRQWNSPHNAACMHHPICLWRPGPLFMQPLSARCMRILLGFQLGAHSLLFCSGPPHRSPHAQRLCQQCDQHAVGDKALVCGTSMLHCLLVVLAKCSSFGRWTSVVLHVSHGLLCHAGRAGLITCCRTIKPALGGWNICNNFFLPFLFIYFCWTCQHCCIKLFTSPVKRLVIK